eukprot:379073-Ditylum_brightwellii.AAC.1
MCKNFYLPEGCAILMNGPVVGRVTGSGEDTRGVGRWCYVKLNGTGEGQKQFTTNNVDSLSNRG